MTLPDADRYWLIGLKSEPGGVSFHLRASPVSLRDVLYAGRAVGDFGCEFLVVCSCEPDVPLLSALVQAGQSLAEQSWVVAILSTRDIRAMLNNIEAANSHIAPTVPMISPLSDEWH